MQNERTCNWAAKGLPDRFRRQWLHCLTRALLGAALLTADGAVPAAAPALTAAQPCLIREGTRLAMLGDSITEQKLYTKFVETYLLVAGPATNLSVMQFGWSGDIAPRLVPRLANDVLPWRPTLATTCYGMNDGGGSWSPFDTNASNRYTVALSTIVTNLKGIGTEVVVGGPGVVDSHTFKSRFTDPDRGNYNGILGRVAALGQSVAIANQCRYADVYHPMLAAMEQAKAAYGAEYPIAPDGIHPGANGHVVMAYAFLVALGVDGAIGEITLDWAGEQAEATEGHCVLAVTNGAVTLESRRYPFCFWGEEKSPQGTAGILAFVPFQNRLNRYVLKVNGIPTPFAEVKWGEVSKTFSAQELLDGVNLAADFLDNPFRPAFETVMKAVGEKQAFETMMIKSVITNHRQLRSDFASDTEMQAAMTRIDERLMNRQEQWCKQVRDKVTPVRHVIEVIPKDNSEDLRRNK
ncbi:MAG: GDSL-type esterase/lipase family protein [Kiritimatiellia bacterium]